MTSGPMPTLGGQAVELSQPGRGCPARLLFLLCLIVSVTTTGDELAPGDTFSSERVLIAIIPRDSPPDYELDANGRPVGFAIEVMELIARRAGFKVRYQVEDNWDKTIAALRAGRADVIPNLGITEERRKTFAFSNPLETFRISLFVRSDSHTIRGFQDLAGKRVAVIRANAAEKLLQSRTDIRLVSHPDFPDALFALLSGNVDALVYPEPWTWKRARAAQLGDEIKTVGEPLVELKRALAVRADNRELLGLLSPAVRDVLASPEFRAVYRRWIGTPEPFWTLARLAWVAALVLSVTILAMSAWRYRSTARAYHALKTAQTEQDRTEARRQTVFETTSVSLWEEDISEVRRLIESRRADVFTGWNNYCDEHPELVAECVQVLRVLDVNQATLRLYEAGSKEQLLGAIEKIFTVESYEVFKQELVAIAEGRRHFTAETVNQTLSGKRIDIMLSISLPPANSPSQRMVAAVLDITDRKQALEALRQNEERLRAIINVTPVPYALNDEQHNITFLNPEFIRTFGYTLEDIPNLSAWWPKAYPDPDYREWVMTTWRNHLEVARRTGASFEPLEFNIRCKDGTFRTVLVGAASLGKSWQGNHLVILYDITERKLIETERERLLKELTLRNTEMESFVYTISHDLKSPLITIDGFAKLLAKDLERGDKARAGESLKEIHKAADGMRHLIEDLLLLSRTGHVQGEPEAVDFQELLSDIRLRCASHIAREAATIRVASPLPRLLVDRARFGEVLQNLLDNAVKFHRDGVPPVVEVGAERYNGEVRLYVRDNGIGIEKRYQEKVFGLFQRLDTGREGTGVGLTIARRIVEQHGGRLWVESEPGQGCVFWLTLPESVIVDIGARHPARETQPPKQE